MMIFYNCKQCGRDFDYNNEEGYSREFCSVTCDYGFIINQLRAEIEELTERFNDQAICAEVFAETRGENVLLRAEIERLKKINRRLENDRL